MVINKPLFIFSIYVTPGHRAWQNLPTLFEIQTVSRYTLSVELSLARLRISLILITFSRPNEKKAFVFLKAGKAFHTSHLPSTQMSYESISHLVPSTTFSAKRR